MTGSVAGCYGSAMLRRSLDPALRQAAFAVLVLVAGAAPAAAAEERACLSGSDAQAAVYAGQARKLSELRGAFDGELIRADLCRQGAGYVYVVTTLGANGKVSRRLVDATPAAPPPPRPAAAAQPMLAVPVRPAY